MNKIIFSLFLLLLITAFTSCKFFSLYSKKPEVIGAVAPSSHELAGSMLKHIDCNKTPKKILEVGAGTGVVTKRILKCLKPKDELLVYEIEPDLCASLNKQFSKHNNVKLKCLDINKINKDYKFDYIVSTLPFNSFNASFVKNIFKLYFKVLKPEGVLSFFEYAYIPKLRKTFSFGKEYKSYRKLRSIIETNLNKYKFDGEFILVNIPPANIYYLKNT